jgi:hypothetical protein
MLLLRHIPLNTMTALMMFAAMALLLALASGGTIDRMLVRLVIEFPLLMVLAAVFTLFINCIAAIGGAILGNSTIAAASIAAIISWTVAGGPNSFAGLGYHSLLQPALALAIAAPWLFGLNLITLISGRS